MSVFATYDINWPEEWNQNFRKIYRLLLHIYRTSIITFQKGWFKYCIKLHIKVVFESVGLYCVLVILVPISRYFFLMMFFLGNEDIHLLTTKSKQELQVDLQKFSGEKINAKFSTFSVASEAEKYKLTVGGYSGTAGNYIFPPI